MSKKPYVEFFIQNDFTNKHRYIHITKEKKDINYNNHQKIITWQLDKISKMPSLQLFIGNIFFLRSVDI